MKGYALNDFKDQEVEKMMDLMDTPPVDPSGVLS